MNQAKARQLFEKAAIKALTDKSFRAKLFEDANAAVKAEYGEDLPFKVTFHPSSEKDIVFVLPEKGISQTQDEKLAQVAGGMSISVDDLNKVVLRKVVLPTRPLSPIFLTQPPPMRVVGFAPPSPSRSPSSEEDWTPEPDVRCSIVPDTKCLCRSCGANWMAQRQFVTNRCQMCGGYNIGFLNI